MIFICIFFQNNLHISKICCTFAAELEKEIFAIKSKVLFNILTIRFYS